MENIDYLDELIMRYPQLEPLKREIQKAADGLIACYEQGNKLLLFRNYIFLFIMYFA